GGDRPAQVGGDGFGGGADVQRQADGAERGAVQGGAEPGGQPAGAGEGVGGEGEQRPAQPVAGGRAERLAPGGGRRAGWCPAAGGGAAAGAAGPRGVLGTGLLSAIGGGAGAAAHGLGWGVAGTGGVRRAGAGQERVDEPVQGGPVHVAGDHRYHGGVAR